MFFKAIKNRPKVPFDGDHFYVIVLRNLLLISEYSIHKYGKIFLKEKSVSGDVKKRTETTFGGQHNALLHPYFTLMCNLTK